MLASSTDKPVQKNSNYSSNSGSGTHGTLADASFNQWETRMHIPPANNTASVKHLLQNDIRKKTNPQVYSSFYSCSEAEKITLSIKQHTAA